MSERQILNEIAEQVRLREAAEARADELERQLEAAWAPDRHGHQISGPRWSLRDIEQWMKAMLADEGQRETVLALARSEQARREADELREALRTASGLIWEGSVGNAKAVIDVALAGEQAEEQTCPDCGCPIEPGKRYLHIMCDDPLGVQADNKDSA